MQFCVGLGEVGREEAHATINRACPPATWIFLKDSYDVSTIEINFLRVLSGIREQRQHLIARDWFDNLV